MFVPYFILIRLMMPTAAAEPVLLIPDDVELESTTTWLGGAGAILTSFDFAPRPIFVTRPPGPVGDSMALLFGLGTIVVLLVGDALIVMDLEAITAIFPELAP